jgi:hypothetical protein
MTTPRIVVAGATMALTRRTVLRKAFLAPWDPMVDQMWLYALADAARETEVAVHFSGCDINHHHTDVTGTRDNLPEFTRRFHRDLSCGLHTLLCARKYDAPRELFDDRPTHWVRLLDAPAQASRLIYDITNPVAAGLVARPEHMPMRTLDVGLWKTGYIDIARPPLYFDESRPEIVRLYLTPPPLLYEAFGGDLDALVFQMKRLENDAIRALRDAQKRPVMGAKNVTRIHPWSEPRTMREPGGNPVPTFRIGARGILGRTRRIEGACEVRAFRHAHRDTRIARATETSRARTRTARTRRGSIRARRSRTSRSMRSSRGPDRSCRTSRPSSPRRGSTATSSARASTTSATRCAARSRRKPPSSSRTATSTSCFRSAHPSRARRVMTSSRGAASLPSYVIGSTSAAPRPHAASSSSATRDAEDRRGPTHLANDIAPPEGARRSAKRPGDAHVRLERAVRVRIALCV